MQKKNASPIPFSLQSAFLWGSLPILYAFLPVYLSGAGLKESQIGIVMALGPLMAALLQPFIGVRADRSKSKNAILMVLIGGSSLAIVLLPLNTTYTYILAICLMMASFQSAQTSLSETITLEYLENSKGSYGPIRAAGTVGYSVVSILLGLLVKEDIRYIFYVTAATGFFCMMSTAFFPKVRGHQSEGNPVSIKELFKDKLLILFMFFSMMAQLTISFYSTFFPLYFASVGGSEESLGIIYFIAAMSELPFLFFADKIIRKLGIPITLILSMGINALRFLLLYIIGTPIWIYPVSILHGNTFIVFAFSLAIYISKTVKKELRATGQTFHGFVSMGLGRILGSVLGGYAVEAFGLKNVMLYAFILCMASTAVFIGIGSILKRRSSIVFSISKE
jgi:PPP family 3-phenylpropionic acid transporter